MSESPPLIVGLLLLLAALVSSQDVFCGHLSVFKQQWFAKSAVKLNSLRTVDLKECLQLCCGIPNCKGVTFTGVIEELSDRNCILVNCGTERCALSEKSVLTQGVLSVLINRTSRGVAESSQPPPAFQMTRKEDEDVSGPVTQPPSVEMETTPGPANLLDRFVRSEVVPIWVIGVAIVVVIVCIGLNVGLLSAYLCYRRRRNKRNTAQISGGMKSATLHAFNPST